MRNMIVQMSLSLDGFVAPVVGMKDHRTGLEDPDLKNIKLDWLREVGTHAMGRVTYLEMAAHWPRPSAIVPRRCGAARVSAGR